jgi:hypothetical protein
MPKRHGNAKFRDKMYKEVELLGTIFCASDEDLARFWGVNPETVRRWKRKNPKFCGVIDMAKQNSKASLHSTLFRLANGKIDSKGVVLKEPNLSALIFLLTNKYSDEWKDRRASTVSNQIYNKVGGENGQRFSADDRAFQEEIRVKLGKILEE